MDEQNKNRISRIKKHEPCPLYDGSDDSIYFDDNEGFPDDATEQDISETIETEGGEGLRITDEQDRINFLNAIEERTKDGYKIARIVINDMLEKHPVKWLAQETKQRLDELFDSLALDQLVKSLRGVPMIVQIKAKDARGHVITREIDVLGASSQTIEMTHAQLKNMHDGLKTITSIKLLRRPNYTVRTQNVTVHPFRKLAALRYSKHLTCRDLAELSGINTTTLSLIENGKFTKPESRWYCGKEVMLKLMKVFPELTYADFVKDRKTAHTTVYELTSIDTVEVETKIKSKQRVGMKATDARRGRNTDSCPAQETDTLLTEAAIEDTQTHEEITEESYI